MVEIGIQDGAWFWNSIWAHARMFDSPFRWTHILIEIALLDATRAVGFRPHRWLMNTTAGWLEEDSQRRTLMRSISIIAVLALTVCPAAVDAGTPQHTAVMKISGVPGQFIVQIDPTDWSQLLTLADSRAPSTSGTSNPLRSRSSSSLASRVSGGARSGEVGMQDITITRTVDHSSTEIAARCSVGAHIPEVTLKLARPGGNKAWYIEFELKNVLVTSFATSGSGQAEDVPTESLSMHFEEIDVEYTEADSGAHEPGNIPNDWNVPTATPDGP